MSDQKTYNNDNSFIMYANKFKVKSNQPDLMGSLTDERGIEYRISAWIRVNEAGQMKSIAGKIQLKSEAFNEGVKKKASKIDAINIDEFKNDTQTNRKVKRENKKILLQKQEVQRKIDENPSKIDGLLF